MTERLRTRRAVSAGGVVYRRVNGRIEFLLGCVRDDIWMLPKGTPRRNEPIEAAAAREVREETGLDVMNQGEIGSIDYWFVRDGSRFHKTVYHFLFLPIGGDTANRDREFEIVEWFPADEAISRLTYPNEAEIARRARERLDGGSS